MQTVRMMRRAYLATAVAALGLAACQPVAENAAVADDGGNQALPLPPLPVAEPPMNREALLLAVARAASSAWLGRDDSGEQRKLDGRRFEFRIRFGCGTASEATEAQGRFRVRFGEKDRTLRLSAAPDLGIDDAPVAALRDKTSEGATGSAERPDVEAVEGFWIERPWLLADGCAAIPRQGAGAMEMAPEASEDRADRPKIEPGDVAAKASPPSVPSVSERVGLAEFFTSTDSRTGRRDERAYEVTKVLDEGEQPSAQGYNLVLSGRLRAQPVGRVISCQRVADGESPPCIVSAEFDRVLIERADSKEILAKWGS